MKKKTEEFYKEIMDKLINEMKTAFTNEGYDEETLKLLRTVSLLFNINDLT